MEMMLLSELAAAVGSSIDREAEIREISTDTRQITPGCLFVALRGERFDGHDFVATACEQGAVAAVTEAPVAGCPCIVVPHTGRALLDIARHYRKKFEPFLVGITGSVGKTTTKNMIALVLSAAVPTLKTEGNFNNEIGLPKTLLHLNAGHRAAVIEMGMSDFGEISRLTRTALPNMAVITNIGFSHIGQLKSQEGILKAKFEILEGMAPDAPIALNADDPLLFRKAGQLNRPVMTYGIDNPEAQVRAMGLQMSENAMRFTICHQGEQTAVMLPCVGRHNVLNALAAFCVGSQLGISPARMAQALAGYQADGMRQNIQQKNGQTVFLDCYNASPDSMRASLGVLAEHPVSGRRVAVLGDMLELGAHSRSLHEMVGEIAGNSNLDALFCYGPESVEIAKRAKQSGVAVQHFTAKAPLIAALGDYLKPGDAVLFKASRGMRLEEVESAIYDDNNGKGDCETAKSAATESEK